MYAPNIPQTLNTKETLVLLPFSIRGLIWFGLVLSSFSCSTGETPEFLAELQAQVEFDTSMSKFGNLSIRQILVITARPPAPKGNQCEMSNFLASVGACTLALNLIIDMHIMVNLQLSKQGIRWKVSHDRIAGAGANSSRPRVFFKFSVDQLLAFH